MLVMGIYYITHIRPVGLHYLSDPQKLYKKNCHLDLRLLSLYYALHLMICIIIAIEKK